MAAGKVTSHGESVAGGDMQGSTRAPACFYTGSAQGLQDSDAGSGSKIPLSGTSFSYREYFKAVNSKQKHGQQAYR